MITQYSRVQLTLSEKEKEYAWFPILLIVLHFKYRRNQ